MEFDLLTTYRDGPVITVTMDRPKQLNALSLALEDELRRCFRALSADDGLRAIVLTGAGRAFSAGVDLKELASDPAAKDRRIWHGPDSLSGIMRACPHVIITAVNGYAITGGLELALLGDIVIASDTAQFADTHARVGITPAWGLSQILPRLIGVNRAKHMSLTGEYVFAARAVEWGLVNEAVPPGHLMTRALELAKDVADTDPVAAARIKRLIDDSVETTYADGLAREIEVFDAHMPGVRQDDIGANRERVQARARRVQGFQQ